MRGDGFDTTAASCWSKYAVRGAVGATTPALSMIVWFVWSVVVAAGIAFVYVAASYWSNLKKQYLVEMPPKETYTLPPDGHEYTKEELAQYDGDCGKAILIALKGTVYDITSHPSGRQFYGKSAGYGIFAGKDASRALATMTFDDIVRLPVVVRYQ